MITVKKINAVLNEVSRFRKVAIAAKDRLGDDKFAKYGCRETGAVRRASMDLTRALADLRKTDGWRE